MRKRCWLGWVLLLGTVRVLPGCAGLSSSDRLLLTSTQIERSLATDLGQVLEVFEGLDVRRPEVELQPASDRLQISWNLALPGDVHGGALGMPVGVRLLVSGHPRVDASGRGVDLVDVHLDDVAFAGMPRLFGLGFARLVDRKGAVLADFPLLTLPADRLVRDHVLHVATGARVTSQGLRIELSTR